MDRNKRFLGKVVLVTGGNGGIGFATAQRFAQEGANIVIAARRDTEGRAAVERIIASGGTAYFVQTDVSDAASARHMVKECERVFGGLDFAYNNAGITGSTSAPIVDADVNMFDQVMAINARGVWLSMKYEFEAMLRRGGGAIVNCSSTAGINGGTGNASAYYASKHAVIGMTKQIAAEGARQNIRVNAVLPGLVITDITRNSFRDNPDKLERFYERIPMSRAGNVDEVANAVLWLCSDESSFVTGAALPVDGGTIID